LENRGQQCHIRHRLQPGADLGGDRFMTLRLIACAVALVMLAAAGADAAPTRKEGSWQVVLVAGDRAQPVFDNATRAFERWLIAKEVPARNIRRFTASLRELNPNVGRAIKSQILDGIATLPARRGDRCLVFVTSHGTRDQGVYLAAANETLTPGELARALARGCGHVPTVAIVSACYSGIFAAPPVELPNRVVLTAARADRPSFGCQTDRTFTFFDECLLGALPKAATWRAASDQTSECVRHMEQQLNETPSEPQAYFGAGVRNLPLHFGAPERSGERLTRR
jgi:hypothetical protein